MAPDIIAAIPRGPYVVRVVFADGEVRDVDMRARSRRPRLPALRDADEFTKVFVDPETHTIAWPNGSGPRPGRDLRPEPRAGQWTRAQGDGSQACRLRTPMPVDVLTEIEIARPRPEVAAYAADSATRRRGTRTSSRSSGRRSRRSRAARASRSSRVPRAAARLHLRDRRAGPRREAGDAHERGAVSHGDDLHVGGRGPGRHAHDAAQPRRAGFKRVAAPLMALSDAAREREGPREAQADSRASSTRLKGVSKAARRQWLKPASRNTSASRASPAWAPSAWPPFSEIAWAVHSTVEAE